MQRTVREQLEETLRIEDEAKLAKLENEHRHREETLALLEKQRLQLQAEIMRDRSEQQGSCVEDQTQPNEESLLANEESFNLLNQIIDNNYKKNRVTRERIELMEEFCTMLGNELRQAPDFSTNTIVHILEDKSPLIKDQDEIVIGLHRNKVMFGSLVNGFGTMTSDVDICVTSGEGPPQNLKEMKQMFTNRMILPLASLGCTQIAPVPLAKVPIVKFQWISNDKATINGDVSFYNCLALHNTQLLRKYTEWEPERLPKLGLFIKEWAKTCNIGSATSGSLSSYAYNIMLIKYLQEITPPILPKLQTYSASTGVMVDGWDVQFNKTVVPNWSTNNLSAAELFIGFIKYFRENINIVGDIFIYDPFEKNRNLGSTAKRDVALFIKRTIDRTLTILKDGFTEEELNISKTDNLGQDLLVSITRHLLRRCKLDEILPVKGSGLTSGEKRVAAAKQEFREGKKKYDIINVLRVYNKSFFEQSEDKKSAVLRILNRMIDNNYENERLTEDRQQLVTEFRTNLQCRMRESGRFFGAEIEIVGSHAYGLASISSNVDLCVRNWSLILEKIGAGNYLTAIHTVLNEIGGTHLVDVSWDNLKGSWEKKGTSINFNLYFLECDDHHEHAKQLQNYVQEETEQLPKLVHFIRKWTISTYLVNNDKNMLTSYAFTLLLKHYLQENKEDQLNGSAACVAELFVGFFQFYLDNLKPNKKLSLVNLSVLRAGNVYKMTKIVAIQNEYTFKRTLAVLGSGFTSEQLDKYDTDNSEALNKIQGGRV